MGAAAAEEDKKKKMKKKTFEGLPFNLIASEILSRIPSKSDIGRCRCVCKEWNSYLSTPMFNRMHLRRHVSISDYKVLLFDAQLAVPFCRLPFNYQTIPKPNPNPSVVCIIASLDGLVCLGSREEPATLMLWNPFTGAYKKLPCIPCMYTLKDFFTKDCVPIGFYTTCSNDYKLVCLISSAGSRRWAAQIYSNRWNSWKKIELGTIFDSFNHNWFWSQGGTFCNQSVYFSFFKYFNILNQSVIPAPDAVVICFDVETETFRKIPYPPIPDGAAILSFGSLVVLNGCRLHVCVSYTMFNTKHVDLWRMMDDGTDEWVKVAAFSHHAGGMQQQQQQGRRICTASVGNWLAVLDEDDNTFKKINTEDFIKDYHYFRPASREHRSSRIVYAETLVSPTVDDVNQTNLDDVINSLGNPPKQP